MARNIPTPRPPQKTNIVRFFLYGLFPFVGVHHILKYRHTGLYAPAMAFITLGCFLSWIVLLAIGADGLWALAWVLYTTMAFVVSLVRNEIRTSRGIFGNPIEDFATALFMYPNALVQCMEAVEEDKAKSS